MRKLRLLLLLLTVLLVSLLITGCPARVRKPAPAPAPSAPSKLSLETIDQSKAPTVVKDLIAKQKDKETFNVVRDGSSLYAVVTRGKVPFKDIGLKFKDVERVDLGNGKSQVRIQVTETLPDVFPRNVRDRMRNGQRGGFRLTPEERAQIKAKLGTRGEFYPVAVAKLNINNIPDVFSFNMLREKAGTDAIDGVAQGTTPAAPESSTAPSNQVAVKINVATPPANSTVTTPLTVAGTSNSSTVTIDLKDNKGAVIATKTVGVGAATNQQAGDFTTTLTYTPPSQATTGTLEVYSQAADGTKTGTVVIPVTIR